MFRKLLHTRRPFERAFSLIEALIAVVVLMIAFLAFSSGMIIATQGQNKAAVHTRAIEAANYLLEQMRRDTNFWSAAEGYSGSCTSGGCWTAPSGFTDDCSNAYPAYHDTFNTNYATWHTGCVNGITQSTLNPISFKYLWRADVHGTWNSTTDNSMADLTVWVYANIDGREETYKVTGMARSQ